MMDKKTKAVINGNPLPNNICLVTRAEWEAKPSKEINYMGTPVSRVFIHHTAMEQCFNQDDCSTEMRTIQDFHQITRGWDDIGYNFLIGEDGRVYEGRGWDRIGAHTYGWNDVAIAFSIMGDFSSKLPDAVALQAVQNMISYGITLGKITPDYKLYGHRDVRATTCPGDTLYNHIQTWDHFGDLPPVKPSPIPYVPTY
ncbi:N-acetylmuramoyl-L-alanine amidase [Mactra antiquata]